MSRFRKLLMPLIIVTAVALAGCANTKPTASEWSAKFIEICTKITSDRNALVAKTLSPSEEPTVEQYMAVNADMATILDAAIIRLKALDRPDGLDTKINELFAALDIASNSIRTDGSDRASAELSMTREATPPEFLRLESAANALGLGKCNE